MSLHADSKLLRIKVSKRGEGPKYLSSPFCVMGKEEESRSRLALGPKSWGNFVAIPGQEGEGVWEQEGIESKV